MSNKHYIKGLKRRMRRAGQTTVASTLEQQLLAKAREHEAQRKVSPRDVQLARASVARRTKRENHTDELARLVREDAKRRAKVQS